MGEAASGAMSRAKGVSIRDSFAWPAGKRWT